MSDTVFITVPMDTEDFWSCIMGSGWEQWDWWTGVEYLDGADWNKPGRVKVTVDNPDSKTEKLRVVELGIDEILNAWNQAVIKCHTHSGGRLDIEDLDADTGDCVMQYAVFGKVVYA